MKAPRIAAAGLDGWPERMARLKERARAVSREAFAPLVRGLARLGIRPASVTALGFFFSLVAALVFFDGAFRWGAALMALGGLCDVLDGQLARELRAVSRFGALLDSTLDRLGEAAILAGIAGFYLWHLLDLLHDPALVRAELHRGLEAAAWARVSLTAVLALVGSFMVSYTRARAEGLGLECRVGWFERPERLVLVMVAGAFGVGWVMPAALLLLTLLSFLTAAQRVAYVWSRTRTR